MNEQELIDKYEAAECVVNFVSGKTLLKSILRDLKQLDEREKVKVPQFVADWINHSRNIGRSLFGAMSIFEEKIENKKWMQWAENQELFAQAWIFGYEVEEEKRYLVKAKGVKDYGCYLNKGLLSKEYFWESKAEIGGCRTKHTRKQLEDDDFGWVFDCPGIEIEEVEG